MTLSDFFADDTGTMPVLHTVIQIDKSLRLVFSKNNIAIAIDLPSGMEIEDQVTIKLNSVR